MNLNSRTVLYQFLDTCEIMHYRPTISILQSHQSDTGRSILDEIRTSWLGEIPIFTTGAYQKSDIAVSVSTSHTDLVSQLPSLIELYSLKIPTIVVCSELGDLKQIINQLCIPILPYEIDSKMIVGLLLGMLESRQEVSELRCKVGLMKKLHSSLQDELELVQNDLDTAAVVQREFMSDDINEVNGVSFSTIWKPLEVVSGDVFDISQLDDDHVAFFIADAIGHGISAAMLAMMLNRTLASNRFDPISGQYTEPKDLLATLNHALLQRSGDQARFATAAYGILNCKTNMLTYAGAGHPPALLKKRDHPFQLIDSDGPLLGVFDDDNDFNQNSIQLDPGDTLLIYSDGFENVFGSTTNQEGHSRTHLKAMSQFCENANGDVIRQINHYLDNSKPASTGDDLTMICLQTAKLAA